jgi:hypothetical protein
LAIISLSLYICSILIEIKFSPIKSKISGYFITKAIALPHPQTRSLSHTPNSDRTPTSQIAIASSHPKQRSHPNTPKAITHPLIHKQRLHPKSPKSDRTPTSSSSDRIPNIPNKRSHSHTPKAIAPPHPQTAIPTERFAIASPHSQNSDRTPTPQKAIPTERFAIAFPHPQTAIASQHPKSDSYGALRYRIPTSPKQRFLRSASLSHPTNPQKRYLLMIILYSDYFLNFI